MRTISRVATVVITLVLLAAAGPAQARGIHSLVESVSGKSWDGKLEQGETLRINVNAHGIDFAKSVRSSHAQVEARLVGKKTGPENFVGGVPMGQITVELKAGSNAPLAQHTITVVVGPNPFYDVLKDSEESFHVRVQARGTGPAPVVAIGKEQRDVVLFLANLAPPDEPDKSFYEFVSFAAESLGRSFLQPHYRAVHLVKGRDATLPALSGRLNTAASNPAVKAVDLIFVTHGLSDRVVFSDGRKSMAQVKDDIISKLSAADRAKLRMVFSTACFGATHRDEWMAAGFNTVSGSRKIYADSGTSYPAFLAAWVGGQTFSAAVKAANDSDPLRLQDKAAVPVLRGFGMSEQAAQEVDSVRLVGGNHDLKIGTMQ
jgi:hypothetical protein